MNPVTQYLGTPGLTKGTFFVLQPDGIEFLLGGNIIILGLGPALIWNGDFPAKDDPGNDIIPGRGSFSFSMIIIFVLSPFPLAPPPSAPLDPHLFSRDDQESPPVLSPPPKPPLPKSVLDPPRLKPPPPELCLSVYEKRHKKSIIVMDFYSLKSPKRVRSFISRLSICAFGLPRSKNIV